MAEDEVVGVDIPCAYCGGIHPPMFILARLPNPDEMANVAYEGWWLYFCSLNCLTEWAIREQTKRR